MKRPNFVYVTVVLAVVVLLIACGSSGNGNGNGEPTSDGTSVTGADCGPGSLDAASGAVDITFWHAMTAENEETLNAMIDDFNGSQDQVHVNLVFQGNYSETLDKFITALRGGDLPEIVQVEDTATQLLIDSKQMVKTANCIDAESYDTSDFLERVIAFYSVGGELWPMPFNVSNPVLYYNAAAFERAGLDPEDPPQTLDELRAASQAIVDAGEAGHGIAFELSPWVIEQWFGKAGSEFVNNGNGRESRATAVSFNNETGLEIFTFLKDMVDDGLALNVGRNPSGADALLAIGSGDAAMTIATSAALGSVYAVLESGQFPDVRVGVSEMPGIPGEGGVLVGGASLWISGSSSPEQREAAWTLAKWLDEPEQQARWHAGTGYIPIRESAVELQDVQDLWAGRSTYRVAYDQLLAGVTNVASSGPVIGPYAEVREAITLAMERMFLQGQSPEDALAQAEREANDAISSYNDRIGE